MWKRGEKRVMLDSLPFYIFREPLQSVHKADLWFGSHKAGQWYWIPKDEHILEKDNM